MKRWPFELNAGPAITLMAVSLLGGQAVVAADFDGDGRDDLLLRHLHSDDWRYYTLVDDVTVEHALGLETEPVSRFVATGDFDGNGFDDVLLRHYDTLESAYHAVSADGVEVRPIRVTVNPLYDILGAGDFDGDGADEILIRRNERFGAWLYYDIDGTRVTLRRNFGPTQNLDFEFKAIGDINGDGRDDILARHRTRGHWIAYLMNGTRRASLRRPRVTQNPLFQLQGFADMTGDGKADPMLRNVSTGEWIYYATGSRVAGGQSVAMRLHRDRGMTRNDRWVLAALGDFDGDGRATPMLRNRLYGGWLMYEIKGAASEVVRFPGLSTQRAWAAAGQLTQGNPAVFSRLELLQGPPVFRQDYHSGETIGPINASRPENGGEALPPAGHPFIGNDWNWQTRGALVWSAENRGFVTAVWERRMAVAVEATHRYRHPAPTVSVSVTLEGGGSRGLDTLLDITEPHRAHGYRTELVFDLPAELNVPGAELVATIGTDDIDLDERVALFGEVIERVSVTWVPIGTPNYPAPAVPPEGFMPETLPHLPIGRYRTRVAPVLQYRTTGNEDAGEEFNYRDLRVQLRMHHATQACGAGDMYFGIYDVFGLRDAGLSTAFALGFGDRDSGLLLAPMPPADAPDYFVGVYPHELGHVLGLAHSPCGDLYDDDPNYPYPNADLGPARLWHWPSGAFVDADSGWKDMMSYCFDNQAMSDYSYQMAVHYAQAPHFAEWSAAADACWEDETPVDGQVRSLAVIGTLHEDGSVEVEGMAPSHLPPTAASARAPRPAWQLVLTDRSGAVLDTAPLPVRAPDAAGEDQQWEMRVAHPGAPDATVSVQDPEGRVRAYQRTADAL